MQAITKDVTATNLIGGAIEFAVEKTRNDGGLGMISEQVAYPEIIYRVHY